MSTKLKLETIVPEELYIKRKADKQLKEIIEDMGRPASILVSRQMGKTNLLLNAKREYQDENNIFVYIDLSNVNNDIRDCFRYIIDTAIDTNLEYLSSCIPKIEKIREKNISANREHEQELLALLREFKGKIIVCLDEIDSMVNYDFSDQFFSQIRSVYFASRTNYPEFKNLTYILSGVLEPSEIIKDSRKSPFNISEKIYLNDFSKNEFMEFIEKTNFSFLDSDITDYIYEWTSGHPRMIWDVLLKIKDIYETTQQINNKDIDDIINLLYLEHSDIPPVDHMRNLIKKNIEIAKVLLELNDRIDLNISNEIKNKLYLYGLINFNESKKIKIKNKVIARVLNKQFLQDILYSEQTPLLLGFSYIEKGQFKKAIPEFLRALEDKDIDDEHKNIIAFSLGTSFFHLKDYDNSLKYLHMSEITQEGNQQVFFEKEQTKGLCYLYLDQIDESISTFTELLKYNNLENKIKSYINLSNIYLRKFNKNEYDTILGFLKNAESLYAQLDKKDSKIISKIYANKAILAESTSNFSNAIEAYNQILQLTDIETYKVNILLKLLYIDTENRSVYLTKMYDLTMSFDGDFMQYNDPLEFSYLSIANVIYEYITLHKKDKVRELANHVLSWSSKFDSKCALMFMLANILYEYNEKNKAYHLLLYTLENFKSSEGNFNTCYQTIYTALFTLTLSNNKIDIIKKYFKQYLISLKKVNDSIEENIVVLLDNTISLLINHEESEFAFKMYKLIQELFPKISKGNEILKASLLDKNFELEDILDKKIRLSYTLLRILNDYSNQIDLLSNKPHKYFNDIKQRHNFYIFTNKNKLRIGRKDPCPCGSGKIYKNCCRDK